MSLPNGILPSGRMAVWGLAAFLLVVAVSPPLQAQNGTPRDQKYYFPHLAVGASWQTTITYINYSPQEVTCQTDFLSNDGSSLIVSFAGLGAVYSRIDVLEPGGSVHQETNVELRAPLAAGWAQVTCSGPVKASILLRQRNSEGVPTGEARVNATTVPTTRFVTFAEQGEGKFGTGVAYANPSDTLAHVTFAAKDKAGQILATVEKMLLPGGHDAHGMAFLFGLTSFTGSLEITSSVPIVSQAFNFEADPVFSSLPPGEIIEELEHHPDLVVGTPSVTDNSPTTGATFTLSATVRNGGDGAAASTTLRYYRSTDPTITTSDTSVGTDPVGGLPAAAYTSQSISLTAPSNPGTYHYGACVDAVTGESDTMNNCSGSVQVTVSESTSQTSPDLTVGTPSVTDNSPTTGATFTLSATVRNGGDGVAASTTLRYYRSTDATITTSDTSVGADAVAALSAGGSSNESISLTAPSTARTYYYGACVDSVSGESDTTNNCSTSVQVTVSESTSQTSPDLTVGTPSVTDNSPTTGATFTLSATVRNGGDGVAASTTLRYYRSTDATITTSDTSVGADAVAALSAGGSSNESISLTAPSTARTYYYGACVDSVSGESDTTNNCSTSVQVTVSDPTQEGAPDLVVYVSLIVPRLEGIYPGDDLSLSAGVRNDGNKTSASTTLRYYRSTDATITTSDTSLGTDPVGALTASGISSQSLALTAPSPGTYYYGACVDSVSGESDTTNNCSNSVQVTVWDPLSQRSPDLTVDTPSVNDNSPTTGATFTLSATVRNGGDGAAAPTTLRYYRSTDPTITTSDTSVGTDPVGGLPAAAYTSQSISLTAPSNPGTYHYGACVDAVTGESDTTNNCSGSVSITVEE